MLGNKPRVQRITFAQFQFMVSVTGCVLPVQIRDLDPGESDHVYLDPKTLGTYVSF
jgi:hypothetical protein